MADVASASVELFRRRLTARFVEAGVSELEVALRLAAMVDLLVPPLGLHGAAFALIAAAAVKLVGTAWILRTIDVGGGLPP